MKTLIFALASCAVAMASAAEPKLPKFRAVDIDTNVQIGYGVAVADVDGDGKKDILLADKHLFVWYRNPDWKKFVMAEKLTEDDHVCIAAADIDGDGKAEVAVGAGWKPSDTINSGAVFYLVPPADRTQRWEPVRLRHEPTVHRMRWVKNWQSEYELVVVPLHGRGNKAGQGEGVRILSYQVPANPRESWPTRLRDNSLHATHNFDVVEWDGDTAEELLIAGKEGVFLSNWVEGQMKLTQLGSGAPPPNSGAGEIRHGKLPKGKRYLAAVEPMHGDKVAVYIESTEGQLWKRNVIDESLVDGHAVACGDLLKAGYDQIVVGWRAMGKTNEKVGIKLYVPLDAHGEKWQTHLIDDNQMACEDLTLADFNGDNRLDIVAAGRATKNLKIYFNEGSP